MVFEREFNTTVFPTAKAGPNLCATKLNGKLNGVIATQHLMAPFLYNPILSVTPGAASIGIVSPACFVLPLLPKIDRSQLST